MKENGFSLIELLGVIAILGAIFLVFFPVVSGTLNKSEENKYKDFEDNLFLATESYVQDTSRIREELNASGSAFINVGDLIDNGYIKKNMINPTTDANVARSSTIYITKPVTGVLNYKYVNYDITTSSYDYNGLIMYYDGYKKPNNNTWVDLSGNSNDGTMYNFDNTSGWDKNKIHFDGTNDMLIIPFNSSNNEEDLLNGNKDFTMQIMFDLNNFPNSNVKEENQTGVIIGAAQYSGMAIGWGNTNQNNMSFFGHYRLYESSAHYSIGKITAEKNTKYNIAYTYQASNREIKVYINGSLKDTTTMPEGVFRPETVRGKIFGHNILGGNYSAYLEGNVYNAMIYNKVLTATEINNIFQINKRRFSV